MDTLSFISSCHFSGIVRGLSYKCVYDIIILTFFCSFSSKGPLTVFSGSLRVFCYCTWKTVRSTRISTEIKRKKREGSSLLLALSLCLAFCGSLAALCGVVCFTRLMG